MVRHGMIEHGLAWLAANSPEAAAAARAVNAFEDASGGLLSCKKLHWPLDSHRAGPEKEFTLTM